ncbi:MAG TPA: hypothetical protein VJO33_14625 [Gemmatimonadaceae bacterium]|nr:hypothetical protein [Gemmatimonadaceae bacterium]
MSPAAAPLPIDASANREPSATTRDYAAFGGVLRSEIEFPELSAAPHGSRPDWTLTVDHGEPPAHALTFVGERAVREERYELSQFGDGFRLVYSHAGTFDIARDGSSIVWYHNRTAIPELVRSIVLGPAISLALELAGFLCLHGSAVAIGETAVAFVGPKHYGKSTLATALTTAGGRLVGDDLLVVSPGQPPTVRPGVGSVRLWSDMAAVLPVGKVSDTLIQGVKTTVTGFVDEALAVKPTALGAIYVLAPVLKHSDERAGWRSRLVPSEATIALAHQTKLPASLVGLRGAGSQLAAAAAVAATVPVWTLHAVRDVARLGQLVRQIIEWSRVE